LIASTEDNSRLSEHVGMYRVSFTYDPCGKATIMAQQMQDAEMRITFRKWNPDKIDVPFKESTDVDLEDETCANPLVCYLGTLLSRLFFKIDFEETIDVAVDTEQTMQSYF